MCESAFNLWHVGAMLSVTPFLIYMLILCWRNCVEDLNEK